MFVKNVYITLSKVVILVKVENLGAYVEYITNTAFEYFGKGSIVAFFYFGKSYRKAISHEISGI